MTAYSHSTRPSAKYGYWVGAAGSERKVIASDGTVSVPLRNAAGTVQYTKVASSITANTTATASATLTTTAATTLSSPIHFYKVKMKATGNVSAAHTFKVKLDGTTATTTTKTSTTTTTTVTLTAASPTTSPVISVQDAAATVTSNVLSIVSIQREKRRTVMLATVT